MHFYYSVFIYSQVQPNFACLLKTFISSPLACFRAGVHVPLFFFFLLITVLRLFHSPPVWRQQETELSTVHVQTPLHEVLEPALCAGEKAEDCDRLSLAAILWLSL